MAQKQRGPDDTAMKHTVEPVFLKNLFCATAKQFYSLQLCHKVGAIGGLILHQNSGGDKKLS